MDSISTNISNTNTRWFHVENQNSNAILFEVVSFDVLCFSRNEFCYFYLRSSTKIQLRVEHSLGSLMTGYEILLSINSNFRIHIEENPHSKSYIWRANQNENILLQFE